MLRATLLAIAVGCTAAFTALPARSVTHRASRVKNVMRADDDLESLVSKRRAGVRLDEEDGAAHARWLYEGPKRRSPMFAAKWSMGMALSQLGGLPIIFHDPAALPNMNCDPWAWLGAWLLILAFVYHVTYFETRGSLSADAIQELRELGFHPRPLSFEGFATNYLRVLLAPDMLKEGR